MSSSSTTRRISPPTPSSAATGTGSASLKPKPRSRPAATNSSKQIGLVQGDQVNASSLYQYAGIMKVLEKYPDFKVVAKPDSNWDATTARNVTTTMLQQNPDICAIIDFWDGDATGTAAAIRDAGKEGKIALVTTGGGEKVDCDKLESGEFTAVVMTELQRQSSDMNAIIKFLLQSGQPRRHVQDLHLHAGAGLHEGRPQARHLLGREGAAGGGAVSQAFRLASDGRQRSGRPLCQADVLASPDDSATGRPR